MARLTEYSPNVTFGGARNSDPLKVYSARTMARRSPTPCRYFTRLRSASFSKWTFPTKVSVTFPTPFLSLQSPVSGSSSLFIIALADTSNWMRFVRPALTHREQNLIICQQKDGIVFLTNRNIKPKEELKAGPSADYAIRRNLLMLKPDVKEEKGTDNRRENRIF